MQSLRVMISGGGTGGHVFPAIAIANAIKKLNVNALILFVGAKGKMEMIKVKEAGYLIDGLWISGWHRHKPLSNVLFPLKLLVSLFSAFCKIRRFMPHIVVGTGGYASGPLLLMAIINRIPTLIQEQNSFPGITNKFLGKRADKICVAFNGMEKYFPKDKIALTGNPVREDVVEFAGKADEAYRVFNLSAGKKTLLILGGSQGARSVNQCIMDNIETFRQNEIQLIWQTGKQLFHEAKSLFAHVFPASERMGSVHEFINRMDLAYAAADIIVSRAGAIAIAELSHAGKPTILIPYPFSAGDHQMKNALALSETGAAITIKDSEAATKLAPEVIRLCSDKTLRQSMSERITGIAVKNSAEKIAILTINLVDNIQ